MGKKAEDLMPLARSERLIIEELPGELLVLLTRRRVDPDVGMPRVTARRAPGRGLVRRGAGRGVPRAFVKDPSGHGSWSGSRPEGTEPGFESFERSLRSMSLPCGDLTLYLVCHIG